MKTKHVLFLAFLSTMAAAGFIHGKIIAFGVAFVVWAVIFLITAFAIHINDSCECDE